jgi:glutamate-1-semialdehyde 2,1-aminomutase
MFQYYLKDEGVNLSWVGTGRCLFSMDWQPKDFKKLTANMLRAAQRMKDDGWWEVPSSDVLKTVGKEASLALLAGLPKKILG